MQVLLGRHPRVLVAPETKIFYYYHRFPSILARSTLRRIENDLQISLPGHERSERLPSSEALLDVIARRYRIRLSKSKADCFVEKSPEHTSRVRDIIRVLPDSKFIVMVRDGRDVAMSLASMPWISCDLISGITLWKRYTRILERFRQDKRFIFVSYESLVANPEKICREVLTHLSLQWNPGVLSPMDDDCLCVPQSELPWKFRATQPPSRDHTFKWMRELDRESLRDLEAIAGHELQQMGYQTGSAATFKGAKIRLRQIKSVCSTIIQLPPQTILAESLSLLQ
jgi:hypothetical protein